jgi:hypothetical protein
VAGGLASSLLNRPRRLRSRPRFDIGQPMIGSADPLISA